MLRFFSLFLLTSCLAIPATSQSPAAAELTKLLDEFLVGASKNDAAMHDRFWADEVIYTSALGERRGKTEIMNRIRSTPPARPGDARNNYSAEDVRIQIFGNTAVVAFRLINRMEKDGNSQIEKYLNTGTFVRRSGTWQVVAWQATKASQQ